MTVYNNNTGVSSYSGNSQPIYRYGYSGVDIPNEYMISITDQLVSTHQTEKYGEMFVIIKAPMQQNVSTRTESSWTLLSAASLAQASSELSAAFTGRSLVSRYANRQYWVGTSPLDFTISMKFEAIDDVFTEVLLPIIELQRMCLPFSGTAEKLYGASSELGSWWKEFLGNTFLAPPGPDPFTYKGKKIREYLKLDMFPSTEELITVKIGQLLQLNRVIVKDVNIEYASKMTRLGIPVEAIATMHFQTFEILTKETLEKIYSPVLGETQTLADQSVSGNAGQSVSGGTDETTIMRA